MRLDARAKEKPAGVLIDTGTGKRVPFAVKFDDEAGTYEAWTATADGRDIVIDNYTGRPTTYTGRAVGRLELRPLDGAAMLGPEPEKVRSPVEQLSAEARKDGVEQYKRLYFQVWNGFRGEARRCVNDRFRDYLKKCSFLDIFVVKRSVRVGG